MTSIFEAGGSDRMRHESKFSTWIRSGEQSTFVLALNGFVDLETKFSVMPERLLDSIIDDALAAAVGRLKEYLPSGVSIDISSVDLTPIRDQLRSEVADRLTEIGVAVNSNDPVITSIIARYAEVLNAFFQTEALRVWNTSGAVRMMLGYVRPMLATTIRSSPGPIHRKAAI